MKPIAIAIKAIPDIETGRRLHTIQNLSDDGVVKAMLHLHQQKTGLENLPAYLQKILVMVLVQEQNGKLDSTVLSGETMDEPQLLQEYLRLSQGKQQITWNGQAFEYALIQYRLLKHNIKPFPDFSKQIDITKHLSLNTNNIPPSLNEMLCLLDLPHKSLPTNNTWEHYLKNEYQPIQKSAIEKAENIMRIYQRMF